MLLQKKEKKAGGAEGWHAEILRLLLRLELGY